eukprot:365906-Chlamydomonas_euryale.AAC.7
MPAKWLAMSGSNTSALQTHPVVVSCNLLWQDPRRENTSARSRHNHVEEKQEIQPSVDVGLAIPRPSGRHTAPLTRLSSEQRDCDRNSLQLDREQACSHCATIATANTTSGRRHASTSRNTCVQNTNSPPRPLCKYQGREPVRPESSLTSAAPCEARSACRAGWY